MLTESHRASLYQGLTATIQDEEAVAAMLAHFPSHPDLMPATKADLRRTEIRLDTKIDQVATDLNTKIDQVATRLDTKIDQVATDLNTKIFLIPIKIDQVEERLGTQTDLAEARTGERIQAASAHLTKTVLISQTTLIAFVSVAVSILMLLFG